MTSIPKAFHTIEKREMTISEYREYKKNNPYTRNINALKCVECGDTIIYCDGENKVAYFKHSPTPEGHSYCSLYKEGKESNTSESKLRKKFLQEEGISLNYEIIYRKGTWSNLITIPPLTKKEIVNNEENHTKIIINNDFKLISLDIDSEHFIPGEIKKIGLGKFLEFISISFKGDSSKHNIGYNVEGFKPERQLYSSLLLKTFIKKAEDKTINLEDIDFFICKKISGYVYVGRHYLIFSRNKFFDAHLYSNSIKITPIKLKENKNFGYYLYDVVFNKVDESSETFCNQRNVELLENIDAQIIWPPINTIGNYKFYERRKTKMFISFQNNFNAVDLLKYDVFDKKTNNFYLFFKIKNPNANPFYVMLDKTPTKEKKEANIIETFENKQKICEYHSKYLFKKGVLINKIDNFVAPKNNESILLYNSALDRILISTNKKEKFVMGLFLDAVRYSTKTNVFSKKIYDYLKDNYKSNDIVMIYLKNCFRFGIIKTEALKILCEGVHNANN